MASIEKRKLDDGTTSYRVKIHLKGHPLESAIFSRLTDAREWIQKTEADMKAGRHFGASKRHTLNELIDSTELSFKIKKENSVATVATLTPKSAPVADSNASSLSPIKFGQYSRKMRSGDALSVLGLIHN